MKRLYVKIIKMLIAYRAFKICKREVSAESEKGKTKNNLMLIKTIRRNYITYIYPNNSSRL